MSSIYFEELFSPTLQVISLPYIIEEAAKADLNADKTLVSHY